MHTHARDTEQVTFRRGIATLESFIDFVHFLARKKATWDKDELLRRIHFQIVYALKKDKLSTSDAHHAYFQLSALLTQKVVTRSRLVTTAETITQWLKS